MGSLSLGYWVAGRAVVLCGRWDGAGPGEMMEKKQGLGRPQQQEKLLLLPLGSPPLPLKGKAFT